MPLPGLGSGLPHHTGISAVKKSICCGAIADIIRFRRKRLWQVQRQVQTAMMLAQSGSNAGNTKNFLGILAEVQMDGHLPSGIDLLSWD